MSENSVRFLKFRQLARNLFLRENITKLYEVFLLTETTKKIERTDFLSLYRLGYCTHYKSLKLRWNLPSICTESVACFFCAASQERIFSFLLVLFTFSQRLENLKDKTKKIVNQCFSGGDDQ